MNQIIVNGIRYSKSYSNIKMIIFDMAGTVINEGGIVYKTLYNTIKDFGLDVEKKNFYKWNGCNKYEVLNHYLNNEHDVRLDTKNCLRKELHNNFDNNLKATYNVL